MARASVDEELTAQDAVKQLRERGLSVDAIVALMDHRVTARTLYRWEAGETQPQSPSALATIRTLALKSASAALTPDA